MLAHTPLFVDDLEKLHSLRMIVEVSCLKDQEFSDFFFCSNARDRKRGTRLRQCNQR